EPVPDTRPRRVRVAAEHQLPPCGVDLQELGSVGVSPERGVNDEDWGDLFPSVDDLRLAVEDFAQDLLDRLGRIAADGAPRAGLLRWPDLLTGERIDRVDGSNVAGVELGRVVKEEVYLLELLLLNVEHRVRELAELADVVPMPMPGDDSGDIIGVQADGSHLGAQAVPATRGVPVEDIGELLPAAVVQRNFSIRTLDAPYVHRQVDEGRVAHVRLECAVGHVQEPAALHDPGRVCRSSRGASHIA